MEIKPEDRPLAAYGLRREALVLDEIFAVPPPGVFPGEERPRTLFELAAHAGRTATDVDAQLREIATMGEGIEIGAAELSTRLAQKEEGLVLLDVREPWEFEICHIAGSLLLADLDFAALLPQLKAAKTVVAVCHHGVRSYSAAMYLRQQGVAGALSLEGGVEEWAVAVDRGMARY